LARGRLPEALRVENFAPMKRNALKLAALLLMLHTVSVRAAGPEAGTTERVYRDYTEAYQKAAQAYEQSAKQNQNSGYVTYAVLGVFFLFVVNLASKTRRAQMAYSERALEINKANQKLLEEIRDLLKNGRT